MISNKVVLAGAGTMGASLAQVYAQAGWITVLHNRSESGLDRAKKLIEINQQTLVNEGILREIIRNAQVLRKEADFKIDDRIDINITSKNDNVTKILKDNKDKTDYM